MAKAWGWLWGTGKASETASIAANAAATAQNAATSAVVAGISAVVTAGVSIAVTLIVQKILHEILVSVQGTRIVGITEKIMSDMEENLFKSLNAYKESLVKEYQQNIDDMLSDNIERLEEIKQLSANDDSDGRKLIETHCEEVKGLLSEGIHIQQQVPLLQ